MDTEVEDPELIFELPDHTGECQCACEHVMYGPGYTCLHVSLKTNIHVQILKRKLGKRADFYLQSISGRSRMFVVRDVVKMHGSVACKNQPSTLHGQLD